VELNALTLGSMLMIFFAGGLVGWLLRQPKTVTVSPPALEREKTLAEAKHQALMDDIEQHLASTQQVLTDLADRQEKLAAKLNGEVRAEIITDTESTDTDAIIPPRDYADSRGQLQ
jgi:hypothetical protein